MCLVWIVWIDGVDCVVRICRSKMGSPAWKPPESTPPQQGRVTGRGGRSGAFRTTGPNSGYLAAGRATEKATRVFFLGFPGESRRRKAWTPARGLVAGGACAVALIGLWRPRFNLRANSAKKGNGALDGRPRAGTFRHIAPSRHSLLFLDFGQIFDLAFSPSSLFFFSPSADCCLCWDAWTRARRPTLILLLLRCIWVALPLSPPCLRYRRLRPESTTANRSRPSDE